MKVYSSQLDDSNGNSSPTSAGNGNSNAASGGGGGAGAGGVAGGAGGGAGGGVYVDVMFGPPFTLQALKKAVAERYGKKPAEVEALILVPDVVVETDDDVKLIYPFSKIDVLFYQL